VSLFATSPRVEDVVVIIVFLAIFGPLLAATIRYLIKGNNS
jgi:hypothetical protein